MIEKGVDSAIGEALPRYVVNALDIRTSYYAAGPAGGRPVLLLHGMSTSADTFRETMRALAVSGYRLIAPDIPGFGYSADTDPYTIPHLVEWLAAFRQTLDLSPFAIIGHSFGGILATSFTLSYPEDVTRLLLVAPALLSQASYPELLKKVGISLGLIDLSSAVSQSNLLLQRQIRQPFYQPEALDESVWERRLVDYELARASAAVLKASAFHDLRPHLGELPQPVYLVWGEEDTVVPAADAATLAELFANVQVHRLQACGHVPMLEKQEAFQAIARQFLEETV